MIELIKPLGHIATIVAFKEKQDLNLLKPNSVNFTHEFMFPPDQSIARMT